MSAAPRLHLSVADYLDWEERQDERHEYYRGEVFAMAGGTEPHAAIIGNAYMAFRLAWGPRGCKVYTEALRVRVDAADLITYPDLSVVCGEAHFYDPRRTTLLNPTALVEVLSPSTEAYDRTTKLGFYHQIPGLQACVLIAQDRPAVDVYVPDGEGWCMTPTTEGAADVLGVPLPLDALYDGVDFPTAEERVRPSPGRPGA